MTDNRSCVIYALSTMPTKALMLGTCLQASQARSAVSATWFLKTPASRASARVPARWSVGAPA